MPSVGTLNLTVQSNASAVGTSLGELAGALGRVKKAIPENGLGLSVVGEEIKGFITTIRTIENSSSAFKSIESLGNGLLGVAKFLKFSTDSVKESTDEVNKSISTINTAPAIQAIDELKGAIGDGLHLGQAGTQLKNLKEALGGEWNTTNAENAGKALKFIAEGASGLQGISLGTQAKNISAMAQSISEYAQSIEELKTAAGKNTAIDTSEQFKPQGHNAGEGYAQGIREKIEEVKEASAEMTEAGIVSVAAAQESNSPALAYIRLGVYATEGYIEGIKSKIGYVTEILATMTKSAIMSAGDAAPEAAHHVAEAISTTITKAMGNVELPDAIKAGMIKVANETGGLVESIIGSSSKDGYSKMAQIASEAVRSSLTTAMNGAAGSLEYKTGIEAVETEIAGVFKQTEAPIQNVNSAIQEAKENVNDLTNAFKPAKQIIASTLNEFKKSEKNGTFASWMYGPRPSPSYTNNTGFQSGYQTEEERMAKNPQWYQPEEFYNRIAEAAQKAKPEIDQLNSSIENTPNPDYAFVDNLIENASEIDLLNMKIEDMTSRLYEGTTAGTLTGEQIANLVSQIQGAKDKLEELTQAAETQSSAAYKLGEAWSSFKTGIKGMFPTLTSLIKRFAQIAKYRLIRSVLRYITAGFSEGVKNVYQYSKAMGTDLAPAMDSAATAILQMKNSIGAAVAPVIQALIPVLQTVVSWIIKAVNYLNQFLALLRGQTTWTQAIESATTAYGDNANAANGAAKAAKDLLADWDELNIIQSENGGGGGGTNQQNLPDYSSMFQEVSEYADIIKNLVDGIKEQFGSIWNLVKKVGIALLGWKFASAFTGALGLLGSLVAAGAITDLVFNLSLMFDKQYVKTGEEGWLIADFLTTAIGAYLTGRVLKKFLGTGLGTVAAGLTFAVSAGATFAVAENCKDEAKANMLVLTSAIEAGIGAALSIAGFIAAGVSAPLAIVGGVISIGLAAAISYSMAVTAEKEKEYQEMAEEAFSAVGENGISADDYIAALQTELATRTANAKLVYDAYVEVPDLQDKLATAVGQIEALNSIIFGEDKLTEEDAKAFQENWKLILNTLDEMNTKTYSTILSGLNDALASANKDIAERASELRVTFISLEKNVDTETAKMYKEIEDITGRITTNTMQEGDLERYKVLLNSIAIMTGNGFDEIEDALKKGDNIDFSDPEGSIAKAMSFIDDVNKLVEESIKAEQDAVDAERNAIRAKKAEIDGLVASGFLDAEYAEQAKKSLDEMLGLFEQNSTEKVQEYKLYMARAYNQVMSQALEAAGNDSVKWNKIVIPLLKQMNDAGYEISDELMDALKDGLTGDMSQVLGSWFTGSGAREARKNLNVDEIVSALNANMANSFEHAKQYSMPDYYVDVIDMFNLTGWDLLAEDAVKEMYEYLVADLGKYKADLVMEGLGIELPNIDKKELESAVEKIQSETARIAEEKNENVKKHGLNSQRYGLFGMYTPPSEEELDAINKITLPWRYNPPEIELPVTLDISTDWDKEELKKKISSALENGGLHKYQQKALVSMYGQDSYLEALKELMLEMYPISNPDLLNRPNVDLGNGEYGTLLTTTYTASQSGQDGLVWNRDLVMNLTPITPDGKILTDAELDRYVEDLLNSSGNLYELFNNDKTVNGGKGLLIGATVDFNSFEEGIEEAEELAKKLHLLQELYYDFDEGGFGRGRGAVNPLLLNATASLGPQETGTYLRNTSATEPEAGGIDYNQMANSMATATTTANENVVSELRTILTQLGRILNKDWTVVVKPSSDWGQHNQRSGNMWNRSSGENY